MKKLISFFLSVVMLVSVVASVDLSAYAYTYTSGNFNYSVSGSNATITKYTGSSTSVTIPSTINSLPVTSIGDYAFEDCTSLTSVTIPNSVTSIGYHAFENCTSLTSVTIPNSVTSIGSYAFYECTGLTSVTIPNSVTSIGDCAFKDCTSLTSVTIGNSVTSIGSYAFHKCTSLTSVTIGNSVTSIGSYAFHKCTSLTSVTIPNSVTSIDREAFSGCTSLNKVNISSIESWCKISFCHSYSNPLYYAKNLYLNDELVTDLVIPDSVTSIGYAAFYKCTSITSVTIPDSVTSIGSYAFEYCTSLTSVTIPDNVISIGEYAFRDCKSLTSVAIPDSVTSIGSKAFSDCTSLTSVTIPNSVTSIGEYAFWNCTSLTSVTIPNSVTSIGDYAFLNVNNIEYCGSASGSPWGAKSVNGYVDGYLVYKDSTKKELLGCSAQATSVTIPNSVTSIANDAFLDCTSLTNVTIPNSVTSIGVRAFANCTSLTSVTIGDSVTSIGVRAFSDCTSLTSVTIGDSVTSIGDAAFLDCTSLTSVTIPNSVTSIGGGAFQYCTSLISVTIPNSVTSIDDYAFSHCTSLTSVTIPNSVTRIGSYTFSYCTSLTNITVSSGNPNYLSDDGVLFNKDKTELIQYPVGNTRTDYDIPFSVTCIGDSAFSHSTSLTSVTIPNSVSSVGDWSFYNCTSLTSVIIPNSVISIGNYAFKNCISLSKIFILNKYCSIYSNSDTIPDTTIIVGLRESSVKSYADSYNKKFEIISNCSDYGLVHSKTNTRTYNVINPTCTECGSYDKETTCVDCSILITESVITEPIGHEYEITTNISPTVTEDGYVIYTCTRCDDSYTEVIPATGDIHIHTWSEWSYNDDVVFVTASNYKDGTATRTCTECGESETKTIEGTGLLLARTATCEFASEVRVMIGVKTEQTKLFSNVYCKYTREDGKEFVVNSDKLTMSQNKTTAYYPFAITPQSLHSDIKVQFYAVTNDGITVWGVERIYNMYDNYIKPQLRKTTNENWNRLLVELVYYGYENQIKSGWKLDQLLIDKLTDEQKALHSTEELTLNKYLNTSYVVCENPLTTWRSVNLEYGASTNPIFRTRALALTDDIKAVVTIEGDEKVYTYNYSDPDDAKYFKVDADVASDTKGIYFTFCELPAKRLRSKIYVTLYKGDTPITNTLEYSAETYCNSQFKKDPNMTNQDTKITYQLMRYGNAARAYFGI